MRQQCANGPAVGHFQNSYNTNARNLLESMEAASESDEGRYVLFPDSFRWRRYGWGIRHPDSFRIVTLVLRAFAPHREISPIPPAETIFRNSIPYTRIPFVRERR